MKTLLKGAIVAIALTGGLAAATGAADARAVIGLSFNAGNVAFAYQDGYWDRGHHWHNWRDRDDYRYYRSHYRHNFYNWRHDRDHDQGWRRDGRRDRRHR